MNTRELSNSIKDYYRQYGLVQKSIKNAVEHVLGMEMDNHISKEEKKAVRLPVTQVQIKISKLPMEILGYRFHVPGNQVLNLIS